MIKRIESIATGGRIYLVIALVCAGGWIGACFRESARLARLHDRVNALENRVWPALPITNSNVFADLPYTSGEKTALEDVQFRLHRLEEFAKATHRIATNNTDVMFSLDALRARAISNHEAALQSHLKLLHMLNEAVTPPGAAR